MSPALAAVMMPLMSSWWKSNEDVRATSCAYEADAIVGSSTGLSALARVCKSLETCTGTLLLYR